MVRDRIYVGLQAAETKARLLHELRYPFGKLAGTMMWLDYYVAPTARGCVIELVERMRPHIVLLLVRWGPSFFAVMLALPYLIGIAVGRPPEGGALLGALAIALAFQVITRVQARAIAWMLHETPAGPRSVGRARAERDHWTARARTGASDEWSGSPRARQVAAAVERLVWRHDGRRPARA